MPTVNVRYMVDDVDAAVAFYTTHLGFTVNSNAAPAFADVTRGDLRLLLSGLTATHVVKYRFDLPPDKSPAWGNRRH